MSRLADHPGDGGSGPDVSLMNAPPPPLPAPCRLERIHPPDNVWRFYSVALMRDLFGGCILFREWGRIGQAGTVRLTHFADRASAIRALETIVKTKVRRGYRPVPSEHFELIQAIEGVADIDTDRT